MANAHALIIDDSAISIDVLTNVLEAMDVSYTVVQDPMNISDGDLEGVDIVFLDLEMPEADGYSILKYLKDEARINAPIVAHSVHNNELDEARRTGFDSYLGKPIELESFPEHVERILDGEQIWVVN